MRESSRYRDRNWLSAASSGNPGPQEWRWYAAPERAFLELLNELPQRETFHQADMLVEGLSNLRPRLLQKLLGLPQRQGQALVPVVRRAARPRLAEEAGSQRYRPGRGKRMLVRGGRLDTK